jgi:hypothetical protein
MKHVTLGETKGLCSSEKTLRYAQSDINGTLHKPYRVSDHFTTESTENAEIPFDFLCGLRALSGEPYLAHPVSHSETCQV